MNTRKTMNAVLGAPVIAVAGVSRNRNKFGSALFRELSEKGLNVVALNRHMDSFEGQPCYKGIEDLPAEVGSLITVVKPDETRKLLEAAEKKGIRKIWMQQGSESAEAVAFCEEKGLEYVQKACVLMYADPVGSIHKFHRGIAKLFGKYLKAG